MPYLSKKRGLTQQPTNIARINSSNLGSRLAYACLLGPSLEDVVTGSPLVASVNNPGVIPTNRGLARQFNSSSSQYLLPSALSLVTGYPLTVVCWLDPAASFSGGGKVAYSLNGSTWHAILGLGVSANKWNTSVDSSPSYMAADDPGVIGMQQVAVVFRSGSYDMYVNGNILSQASNGSAWGQPAAGNYSIGSRYNGSSLRPWDGPIQDFYVFNGELTQDEIRRLYWDTWQVFKRQDRRIWIPSAGGGSSTNLVIQDSTHALLSDNLDLSTSLLLTIQDSTHSLTSENLTLSTDWLLTIQDSTHNLTSDNLILNITGSTDLIIQEATHSVTSDNLLITTEWLLDIASAAHALTSDNLNLSTALSIVIQKSIHSLTSDNITLDTSNTTLLTIQDAVHSHTADNLGLTLNTWLVIADAVHTHLADSIDLGTELTLTIQSSTHNLTSDIIILSIPSTGSCPTVEEIVAAIMIQIEAKNYLTLPQFLSFK